MKKIILATMTIAITSFALAQEAKVSSKDDFIRLRKNVHIYGGDESVNMVFLEIPRDYRGSRISVRPIYSQDPLVFTVKKRGTVTITSEIYDKKLLEDEGWKVTGKIIVRGSGGIKRELLIWQQELDPGTHKVPNHGTIKKGSPTSLRLII